MLSSYLSFLLLEKRDWETNMKKSEILPLWESNKLKLNNLTPEQVEMIDKFLSSVGDYGEIDLIVQNGELRYINTIESHKTWNSDDGKGR
jgi:hypothetical protein